MITNSPPPSATFIRPRNNVITPIKLIANVTEDPAVSIIPAARTCIGCSASGVGGVKVI